MRGKSPFSRRVTNRDRHKEEGLPLSVHLLALRVLVEKRERGKIDRKVQSTKLVMLNINGCCKFSL